MKDLLARLQRTHAWRAWQAYGKRRGPILAGGIAYAGLFSVFGAVVAGFSVFGLVLGSNGPLFDAVVRAVDDSLPGLLDVPAGDGVIEPSSLVDPNLVSWTGAIAFLTAVLAGLGWLDALREGVRAMAGLPPLEQNVVKAKLVDVGVLATLGLAVLASAVLSIGTGSAASWLLQQVGLEGGPVASAVLRVAAFLVVAAADALILVVVYRLLAGLHLPWVRMRRGGDRRGPRARAAHPPQRPAGRLGRLAQPAAGHRRRAGRAARAAQPGVAGDAPGRVLDGHARGPREDARPRARRRRST